MKNAAYAPTVQWLPELAPTLEARDAALQTYAKQVGIDDPAADLPMFFSNEGLRVWGWIGPQASLLFAFPKEDVQ